MCRSITFNMIVFQYCVILVNCVVFVKGFALPHEGHYALDIIHYNDFHARYEETSAIMSMPTCRFNNNSCIGGFARLYHEIDVLKREKPDSILLNAGDSFQGTYWYTLFKWNVTQYFMNMLPHDAHAIGNHEFDDGPSGLAPYLAALKAPVLAANMDTSLEPSLDGLYQPWIIIEKKGRKIGIIGLITPYTTSVSSPGKVKFTDPLEATRREAAALSKKGVDIIVVLSHCGLEVDKEIAHQHGEYVDIIIGGHSHSLLWNEPTSPTGDIIEGPYPIFIESSNNKKHQVLIVQASSFTKYIGNLTVLFDYKGDYVRWEGGPIFLSRSIPEDENIKKHLEPLAKIVHEAEDAVVGTSDVNLDFESCAYGECALGNLIVDSCNEVAKTKYKSKYPYIALMQRGGLKSPILKGGITKGELFELMPYFSTIVSFELQGIYLREALERSFSDAWEYKPFKGPWVLQVSGLQVTYNISLPEGKRIVSLNVGPNKTPFDNEAYYVVTLSTYLATGGDGYKMLDKYKRNESIIGRDQEILEEYIKRHGPIHPVTDGRITVIQD